MRHHQEMLRVPLGCHWAPAGVFGADFVPIWDALGIPQSILGFLRDALGSLVAPFVEIVSNGPSRGSPWRYFDRRPQPFGGGHGDAMGTHWGAMGMPWGCTGEPWGCHGLHWGPMGVTWGAHWGDAMGVHWCWVTTGTPIETTRGPQGQQWRAQGGKGRQVATKRVTQGTKSSECLFYTAKRRLLGGI